MRQNWEYTALTGHWAKVNAAFVKVCKSVGGWQAVCISACLERVVLISYTMKDLTSMARRCSTRVGVVCFKTRSFMAASCCSMSSVTGQGSLHLAK